MQQLMINLSSIPPSVHTPAHFSTIDKLLSQEIINSKTPSVQYLIFDQKKILYEKRMGLADIESQKPTDKKTKYHLFSITKTFTALAVLQLAEKEKIKLDEPAITYLADFPYSPHITVRQLLTHSAGIPNPMPLSWIHLEKEASTFNAIPFFNKIFKKHHSVKALPNEQFRYSNLGYLLLGKLIETVSQMSYEKYIKTNILEKIGIADDLGFRIDQNHAKGYQKKFTFTNFILGFLLNKSKYMDKSVGKWKPFKSYYVNGQPYGGLIGTADALMKYIQELLKPNSKLISAEYKTLLFTENFTNRNSPTGMCLSWFKGTLNGNTYFTHAGGGGGYYCEVRIYPTLGIGSLVLFNRSGLRDERFLDKVDKFFIE